MTDEATRLALADEIENSNGLVRMVPGQGYVELGIEKTSMVIAALRAIPREPIAQGQREAIKRAVYQVVNAPPEMSVRRPLAERIIDAILATLPQPPVGACREAVIEQCAKLCDEIVARADRCMNDPKAARKILAAFGNGAMECAVEIRALAPSAQEGETDDLLSFVQFVADGWDNQDINHEDFRARVGRAALELLASPHTRPERGA